MVVRKRFSLTGIRWQGRNEHGKQDVQSQTGGRQLDKAGGEDAEKASFPELFFDLVFVFALIQLSHALAKDFGPTAALEIAAF